MAITIKQEGTGIRPVYNDDFIVVTSDKYLQYGFQYVADLFVNGVLKTRLKTFPHPTNTAGMFNVKRIVESYVTKDIDLTTTDFATNDNSWCTYQLSFGEEYGSATSGTTIYSGITSGTLHYCFNGIVDYESYTNFDTTERVLTSNTKKFLTNKPTSINIGSSEKEYLYGISSTSGDCYYAAIATYDSAGTILGVYYNTNPYQAITTDAMKFFRLAVGTADLAGGAWVASVPYSLPIISASVAYYKVHMVKYNGTQTSIDQTYVITDQCTKTSTTRLFFMNKLGGYDAFTFKHKQKHGVDITRSNFKKPQGVWSVIGGNISFLYGNTDRAITQYDTSLKDTITIVSDWITEAESDWLEELLTSPDVYVEKSGVNVPINIVASSYERKQQATAKTINITLEYTYSYNRYRQRA